MNQPSLGASDAAATTGPPWIDGTALRALVPMLDAVDALEAAFAGPDRPAGPSRLTLEVPDGELLLMPSHGPEGVGVKLVTVTPDNRARAEPLIQGVYVLFSRGSQRPEALIDGAALTAVRTAAVSALATRWLAAEDARRLVVFGAGTQAAAHVEAMLAVRPSIERVDVVGRAPARARKLVERLVEQGLDGRAATPDAVREADIVCTCTTAGATLFGADWLAAGAHVNAVGAHRTDLRELEGALLADALLVVESRESALAEAGDVVLAILDGDMTRDGIDGELGDLVRGGLRRRHPGQVSVFKSVGLAVEDLVVARAALDALGRA
jgi:ornithine cyclodeaminase/alanine dehydrogenase-like protein (mu-crystallin family)